MNILLLEAYYGGSHKLWADQLKEYSKHQIQIIALPARHWKWRLEGASFEFIKILQGHKNKPDLIIATSMLDLALLKANLPKGWERVPILYYMHENQLSYPISNLDQDLEKGRDFHYGMIQFKSMLSANQTCFNSSYHKSIFFSELSKLLKKLPDFSPMKEMALLEKDSKVLPLGIQDTRNKKSKNNIPVLLWNHRWEYDKNPEQFFKALFNLKEDLNFQLIVIGARSRKYPAIFDEAKIKLSNEIIHWGFVENNEEYIKLLNKSDYLPVTSNQDFFGISIMEAVLSGVIPILPNRLVYPEHFAEEIYAQLFYDSPEDLIKILKFQVANRSQENLKNSLIDKAKEYLWSTQINHYDQFFETLIA